MSGNLAHGHVSDAIVVAISDFSNANPSATVCAAAHAAWANTCPPYVPFSPPVGEYAFTIERNVLSSICSSSITFSKGSTRLSSVKYGRTTMTTMETSQMVQVD
ncbi:hypothetical protein IG631_03269 [Alternaria alternata]|nr:hypothetical protein IG631_03269 [Alternaria alternata]